MTLADLPAVAALPADEKLALVSELWDAIESEGLPPLSAEQRVELDRRREAFRVDPTSATTLEQIRADWDAERNHDGA